MATSQLVKSAIDVFVTSDIAVPDGDSYVNVTAEVPSGWKFVTWIMTTSAGWIGLVYPSYAKNQTTTFWTADTTQTGRKVRGFFLCERL